STLGFSCENSCIACMIFCSIAGSGPVFPFGASPLFVPPSAASREERSEELPDALLLPAVALFALFSAASKPERSGALLAALLLPAVALFVLFSAASKPERSGELFAVLVLFTEA